MEFDKQSGPPSATARSMMDHGADYQDEGSGERVVHHRYSDPLDEVWRAAAGRLFITVERSDEVFASWNGRDTLTLSAPAGFDPDDSIAQLVLHELSHALVQGAVDWGKPDWGLENTDTRDLAAEHAAQRVQAALARPHGLRWFFAPTTKWRDYFDALPDDPLTGPSSDPAVALATLAYARSRRPPWSDALDDALTATALIARAVAPHASPSSLWSTVTR
jgi:hypothetical protein